MSNSHVKGLSKVIAILMTVLCPLSGITVAKTALAVEVAANKDVSSLCRVGTYQLGRPYKRYLDDRTVTGYSRMRVNRIANGVAYMQYYETQFTRTKWQTLVYRSDEFAVPVSSERSPVSWYTPQGELRAGYIIFKGDNIWVYFTSDSDTDDCLTYGMDYYYYREPDKLRTIAPDIDLNKWLYGTWQIDIDATAQHSPEMLDVDMRAMHVTPKWDTQSASFTITYNPSTITLDSGTGQTCEGIWLFDDTDDVLYCSFADFGSNSDGRWSCRMTVKWLSNKTYACRLIMECDDGVVLAWKRTDVIKYNILNYSSAQETPSPAPTPRPSPTYSPFTYDWSGDYDWSDYYDEYSDMYEGDIDDFEEWVEDTLGESADE